jgi:tetratricopeptide (TPR) repeat protein
MRRNLLVFTASLCVLAASPLSYNLTTLFSANYRIIKCVNQSVLAQAQPAGGTERTGKAATTCEETENHYDVPTSGGKPAFATKADVIISSAQSLIKSKDFKSALKLAIEVTAKYPDYAPGWLILGYAHSLCGDYMASNLAYERALSLGSDPEMVYLRTAYNYLKLQNWDAARASYKQILDLDKNDPEALRQLGYLEDKLGNTNQAIYYYQRVLNENQGDVVVMGNLAKLLEKEGSTDQAVLVLTRAVAVDPENAKYLRKLSSLLLDERSYEKALPILKRALDLEPDNPSIHRNLGVVFYELGEKKKAEGEFGKVAELGGDMDGLYGPLADCLHVSGNTGESLKYIEKGIREGKQAAWLYSIWGKILEEEKDYTGAIAKFTQAVNLNEAPWSSYAKKQIARQEQLKKRQEMIAKQANEK